MMKKGGCLIVMMLIMHGTALCMMQTKKIMNSASRLQWNKRPFCGNGLKDDIRDAAFLRNYSFDDIKKSLCNVESTLKKHDQLLHNWQGSLMNSDDRFFIRQAYIKSIYKVAQIDAMCKIYATSNLETRERDILLNEVLRIVHE